MIPPDRALPQACRPVQYGLNTVRYTQARELQREAVSLTSQTACYGPIYPGSRTPSARALYPQAAGTAAPWIDMNQAALAS